MDVRSYDPAIGRFTSIDPVTHHSMSTYTAFDNNPVFWADPSGADSTTDIYGRATRDPFTDLYIAPNDRGAKNQDASNQGENQQTSNTENKEAKSGASSNSTDPPTGSVTVTTDNGFTVTLNRAIIYGKVRHTNGDGLAGEIPGFGPLLRSGDRLNEGKYLLSALEFGVALVDVFSFGYASTYTIASKASTRVFWSGGNIAKTSAANFARTNGMRTLEMTAAGRVMNSVSPYLPRSVSGPIWDGLSSRFARAASGSGSIHVFQNAAGVSLKSTWRRIEYEIIKNENIIYHSVK